MMTVQIKILENTFSDWDMGDTCLICNRMFSYTGSEYDAADYVYEEEYINCGDCLKKVPEAIKKAAQERALEIRDEIRPWLKEAELLEKIASSDIVYPWDDLEMFSKCANKMFVCLMRSFISSPLWLRYKP